jgi:DNA-binding beta-propeller fold protein YncE
LSLEAETHLVPAGATVALTATALDGTGVPLTGMTLTFSTTDALGGGSLAPLTVTTDGAGQATTALHSTLAGLKGVSASGTGLPTAWTQISFYTDLWRTHVPCAVSGYTPPPPPPPTLHLTASPLALLVGETAHLTATLRGSGGAPAAGVTVVFSADAALGGGALTPQTARTGADGTVTATLRSTLAGTVGVWAQGENGAADATYLTFRSTSFCAPQRVAVAEVGPQPRGVALDTAGGRAFVAHAQGLTVVDVGSFATLHSIELPTGSHGVAYDGDRDRIWVTLPATDRVVILDGATYAPLTERSTGERPHSVAYNPANGRVYVTNYGGWSVSIYDAATMAWVHTLNNFSEPAHLAVNPTTNRIYVANHAPNGHVTVIDGASHEAYRIGTALIDAYGVTVDATRDLIYVTAIAQGRISAIDGATDRQVGTVDVRRGDGRTVPLRAIAVNPAVGAEGHLFVVTSSEDGGEDQLLLIPGGWPAWGTPVPLDLPAHPLEGLALDPARGDVWVSSVSRGLVTVARDGMPVCSTPFETYDARSAGFQIVPVRP